MSNKQTNYVILKKKEGFVINWELNNDQINKINEELNVNISIIDCHMKVWNKIFYEKHKHSTYNVVHNENNMLKNMPKMLTNIFNNNLSYFEKDKSNKYYIQICCTSYKK